jgi:tetratricopeptide (TPR) repeat protein
MQNHQHQGGPIDVDFAIPPESLNYFLVDNQVLATDATKDQSSATLFARPTGPLAFADLFEEKVRITCGEGIWVPIAEKVATKWKLRPWAHGYADIIEKATKDNFNGEKGLLGRDSHWYTNQAISNLETVFLNDESDEENRIQSFNNAKRLLNLGVEATPNDWYIKSLYKGILDLNIKDAPALIHADKIIWSTGLGLKEIIDEEFNRAIELKNNLEVAYHNYALALKQLGHVDESKDILIKLLKINPQHGPANYDLAVLYMNKGNERLELEFYDTAIKAEPGFAPPYYNIGKTFEDQGDIQNAYEYYIKAINADQYFVEPYEQIAIMFYQMNKLDEAEAMLIGALEADPRRLQTYENIIAFCNSTGRQNLVKIAKTKMLEGLPREYKSIYSS